MASAHRRLAMISKQLAPALENKMMPAVAPMPTKASAAKKPVKVVVTGAAGNIAYSIIFMIGQGVMLGPDQPIELRLLDIPAMVPKLKGVEMELQDCAFPLVTSITSTADYKTAFQGVQIALLIGAKPRGPNMERKDLLFENAKIFSGQGKALNDFADRNVKVVVVGNPANTNALICMTNAPNIPKENFSALTRLDQNRAVSQIAGRAGVPVSAVSNVIIWGNHSKTQYPDVNHATVVQGGAKKPVKELIKDHAWLTGAFLTTVQDRGGEVIKARGSSSAASAANAVVDHVRNWVYGTKDGEYVSMAVRSDGSYGVPEGLIYSFPVVCKAGSYRIVKGLAIDKFSREKMDLTTKELLEEKKLALDS